MRRYNSQADYIKEKYGVRLQKLVVDAGFTCPNRDGSKGRGGCTFCDNNAFHPNYSTPDKSISQQLQEGIEFHRGRYSRAGGYLAYFQPYSNTYAPLEKLRALYEEALDYPEVKGIVIGTRPDCIDAAKLDYLADLAKDHIVMVEYGIESCYDATLEHINRGHSWDDAVRAVKMTAERGLHTGAHFILGLPLETREKLIQFIKDFQEGDAELKSQKGNRLFDALAMNDELYERFWTALYEALPEFRAYSGICDQWVKSHLYSELKPSAKLELLHVNEGARIRLIPADQAENNGQWVESMMTMQKSIVEDQGDIDLYVSLNSDDAADTFVVMNILDILVSMPASGLPCQQRCVLSRA